MGSDASAAWDNFSPTYQAMERSTSTASYGFDIPDEAELRLLGNLDGRRILDLGCGGGHSAVAFAKAGATTIGIDFSGEQLASARRCCDTEGVRVELRQGDLADLAFLQADSIDVAFSAYAFNHVEDLNRVLRQVHRVLKVGAPLVFSLPHPAYTMLDSADGGTTPVVRRAYLDRSPLHPVGSERPPVEYPHTFSDLYMSLARASYRVDLVLEPPLSEGVPRSAAYRPAMALVPPTLIIRARKEGN